MFFFHILFAHVLLSYHIPFLSIFVSFTLCVSIFDCQIQKSYSFTRLYKRVTWGFFFVFSQSHLYDTQRVSSVPTCVAPHPAPSPT